MLQFRKNLAKAFGNIEKFYKFAPPNNKDPWCNW